MYIHIIYIGLTDTYIRILSCISLVGGRIQFLSVALATQTSYAYIHLARIGPALVYIYM